MEVPQKREKKGKKNGQMLMMEGGCEVNRI
jgi:hypothetical protein